jgi:NAD(P)-dependent dehydrogenase (short-subunit alcohol dehydrogenase family)
MYTRVSQYLIRKIMTLKREAKDERGYEENPVHPYGGVAHYGACKAGVIMLTKALALECTR